MITLILIYYLMGVYVAIEMLVAEGEEGREI
jgi:hypothetical protein